MPSMKGTEWKKLTRADLTHFDDIATDAVLTAMQHGAKGRVSARGHATIRCADGQTMSVSGNTGSWHAVQDVRRDLRRLFPDAPIRGHTKRKRTGSEAPMPKSTTKEFTAVPAFSSNGSSPDGGADEGVMLLCPAGMPKARKCDAEFATEGARYAHVRDEHKTCEWDGCDIGPDGKPYVALDARGVAGHVNIHHKGNKPWLQSAQASAENKRRKAAGLPAIPPKKKAVAKKAVPSTAPGPVAEVPRVVEQPTEHRGLPTTPVPHRPTSPAAVLAAIRDLLGPDPRVAALERHVGELEAQLSLVREALALDVQPANKKTKKR